MLVLDLFEDFQGPPEPTLIDALRDFLPLAMRHLNIKNLPKITFVKDIDDSHVSTFGHYNHDEKLIFVDIENRHPNDIIRTLAHELIHYAQGKNKELDHDSWLAGSPVENEANAEAGVIMRKFNTKYPQYLKLKPVMFESVEGSESEAEEEEEREESDPTKPIPFPKGTTLVNVSDVYDWYKLGMAVPALDKADPRTFHKGVPHTVFAFGSEEEEHKMIPLLKRLGFSLHDIDTQDDYQKAIRASDVIEHLEQYVAENAIELDEKWSKKYKKSINCSNPKGFSQKAHCAARRARQAGKKTKSKSVSEGKRCDAKGAVPELKAALDNRKKELNKLSDKEVYAKIDKIMSRIAHTYDLTGQELHDMWTERYGEIPDTYIIENYGRYYCSTDKKWKTRQGPKQIRNTNENFADGKKPGRKGLAKRSGVDCSQSVTKLRDIASHSSGERQRMAHWCANMKAGKK